MLLIFILSSFYKNSPPAVQECEVAVRSRTEALADWYKAGEQLVQILGCPQNLFVLIVLLLLYLKELKCRSAVLICSYKSALFLSLDFKLYNLPSRNLKTEFSLLY